MNTIMKRVFIVGLKTVRITPMTAVLSSDICRFRRCMVSSASASNFKSSATEVIVETVGMYGVTNKRILEQLMNSRALTKNNPDTWKHFIEMMMKCGFHATPVVDMVLRYPKLLTMPPKKVQVAWSAWIGIFNQHDLVRNLIREHPSFLCLSKGDIISRCEQLKAVTGSFKFVVNVLSRCPQIMFQNLSELVEVSDYISSKMVIRNAAEYYKSVALGCTLEEVKTRHVFLERCGKYKTPKLKQNEKVPTRNPTLMDMFDTSEATFATDIAGVSVEEFIVFQSMYELEMKEDKENSSLESDEDSDDDY